MNKKVQIEYEEVEPDGILESPPVIQGTNIQVELPEDMSEASYLHLKRSPGCAIIETACYAGTTSECVFMENCPIKSEYEDFLYEKMQKQNIINAIEIRWCGKYQPKNLWSNK